MSKGTEAKQKDYYREGKIDIDNHNIHVGKYDKMLLYSNKKINKSKDKYIAPKININRKNFDTAQYIS